MKLPTKKTKKFTQYWKRYRASIEVLLLVGVVILSVLIGFLLGMKSQTKEQLAVTTVQDKQQDKNQAESNQNQEVLAQNETAFYQFILDTPALIYIDKAYGFDIEFQDELPAEVVAEFPDLEVSIERVLNSFEYVLSDLQSLTVTVDLEAEQVFAVFHLDEIATRSILVAESDFFTADKTLVSYEIDLVETAMQQAYSNQRVLAFSLEKDAVLVERSSGGIPCVSTTYEWLYADESTEEVVTTKNGPCAVNDTGFSFLGFDGTYIYLAEGIEADDSFNVSYKGSSFPRLQVTEVLRINVLNDQQEELLNFTESEEVFLLPYYVDTVFQGKQTNQWLIENERAVLVPQSAVYLDNVRLGQLELIKFE